MSKPCDWQAGGIDPGAIYTTVTAAEAAACDLTEATLAEYCRRSEIKASKLGRDWLIKGEDLIAYLRHRRKPGRPVAEAGGES